MRIIESRRRMLESIGLSGPVFYLQSFDGSVTKAFQFEEGMTWLEFISSNYNDGNFVDANNSGPLPVGVHEQFAGVKLADFIGYNGYVISSGNWLAGDNLSNIGAMNDDLIETDRIYYSDGVL